MSSIRWKPELLAPAKNLERLKVAISYGADAVYVGGQRYGLRARADNFTDAELALAAAFAHEHNRKLYVTLNAFLHDDDFEGLPETCQFLEKIGIDALIVSDLGVLMQVKKHCGIDIHLSTQASCLNQYAAKMWKKAGTKRLILGRELTIEEAGKIQQQTEIDIELFAHGAMCMAYSGHCTISNFTAGRDSNRGGCSQSCRFPYAVQPVDAALHIAPRTEQSDHKDKQSNPTLLSSKDLAGIRTIPSFFAQQICSLKVEGRMKSAFYVATACKVYRTLIDAYAAGRWDEDMLVDAERELNAVPHRDYTTGSLAQAAAQDSVYQQHANTNIGTHKFVGMVLETTEDSIIFRSQEAISCGETIEILPFAGQAVPVAVEQMFSIDGKPLSSIKQDRLAVIPRTSGLRQIEKRNVIRSKQELAQ